VHKKYSKYDIDIISLLNGDDIRCFQAYDSLYRQKNIYFNHIVIYSKKCSFAFIKKLKSKYFKTKFFLEKKTLNKFSALNQGLYLTKSSNIGILHCDDYYENNNLLYNIFIFLKKYDFVFCSIKIINKQKKVLRVWSEKKIIEQRMLLPPHTGLFHKKNIKNFHLIYDIAYPISSDFDYILRLLKATKNYKYLKNFYVCMNSGGDSTRLSNLLKTFIEDIMILKKNKFYPPIFYAILKKINKIFQFI
jgi:hypothetical protein